MKEGAARLNGGADRFNEGAARLNGGADRLNEGAARFNEGAARLNGRAARFNEGAARLNGRAGRFKGAAARFNGRGGRFNEGAPRFNGRGGRFNEGAPRFNGRGGRFNEGAPRFNEGVARFNEGASRFKGAAARFKGATARFKGATARFKGATARFKGATARFNSRAGCCREAAVRFNGRAGRFKGADARFNRGSAPFRGRAGRIKGAAARFNGRTDRFNGHAHRFKERARPCSRSVRLLKRASRSLRRTAPLLRRGSPPLRRTAPLLRRGSPLLKRGAPLLRRTAPRRKVLPARLPAPVVCVRRASHGLRSPRPQLPIGISDFRLLREPGMLYIDKTDFVTQVLASRKAVVLVPRPRRFGKTVNLSTVRYFVEKSREDRAALFEGLAVWGSAETRAYLKASDVRQENDETVATLSIPNKEVLSVYRTIFRTWLEQRLGGRRQVEDLLEAILAGDGDACEELFGQLLQSLSVHDLAARRAASPRRPGKKRGEPAGPRPDADVILTPEQVYHVFVVSLLLGLQPRYTVRSNRESGSGRYDVMILPRLPGQPGVVLELKVRNRRKRETAKGAMTAALRQIRERDYAAELRACGASPIHEIGVVVDGKQARVQVAPARAPGTSPSKSPKKAK